MGMGDLPASPVSCDARSTSGPVTRPLQVILVAPNLAERMGGEAIKALQIYEELARRGIDVHQVTHGRVRDELSAKHPNMAVSYIEDDWLTLFIYCRAPLKWLVDWYF